MTASEIIRSALIKSGKTQKALAEHMGWSKQNLNIRLRNGTLTLDEVDKALDFLGHSIIILDSDGCSLRHYGNSPSPRLSRTINGRVYDTSKAHLIASTKDQDADNVEEYSELYSDIDGEQFVAYHFANGRGTISTDPEAIDRFCGSLDPSQFERQLAQELREDGMTEEEIREWMNGI